MFNNYVRRRRVYVIRVCVIHIYEMTMPMRVNGMGISATLFLCTRVNLKRKRIN